MEMMMMMMMMMTINKSAKLSTWEVSLDVPYVANTE
jgi:hypothetical protein